MTSTDLVQINLAAVEATLLRGEPLPEMDPDAVADSIADRLMNTEDLDALFDPEGSMQSEKRIGEPFWLRSAMFRPSDYEESKVPMYALLDCVDADGRPFVMSCGGRAVLIQVFKLISLGAFPRYVKVVEIGKPKPGRNRPLYLQDVPAPKQTAK